MNKALTILNIKSIIKLEKNMECAMSGSAVESLKKSYYKNIEQYLFYRINFIMNLNDGIDLTFTTEQYNAVKKEYKGQIGLMQKLAESGQINDSVTKGLIERVESLKTHYKTYTKENVPVQIEIDAYATKFLSDIAGVKATIGFMQGYDQEASLIDMRVSFQIINEIKKELCNIRKDGTEFSNVKKGELIETAITSITEGGFGKPLASLILALQDCRRYFNIALKPEQLIQQFESQLQTVRAEVAKASFRPLLKQIADDATMFRSFDGATHALLDMLPEINNAHCSAFYKEIPVQCLFDVDFEATSPFYKSDIHPKPKMLLLTVLERLSSEYRADFMAATLENFKALPFAAQSSLLGISFEGSDYSTFEDVLASMGFVSSATELRRIYNKICRTRLVFPDHFAAPKVLGTAAGAGSEASTASAGIATGRRRASTGGYTDRSSQSAGSEREAGHSPQPKFGSDGAVKGWTDVKHSRPPVPPTSAWRRAADKTARLAGEAAKSLTKGMGI